MKKNVGIGKLKAEFNHLVTHDLFKGDTQKRNREEVGRKI